MSQTKLVTYDLIDEKDYEDLTSAIESYNHVKINLSCYAEETVDSAATLYDDLDAHVDVDDRLFVGTLKTGAKWKKMIGSSDAYKAMKKD